MKNQLIIFSLLLATTFLGISCNQGGEKAVDTTPKEVAKPAEPVYESRLQAVGNILKDCIKAEYLMNNVGITFETQSNTEVMRFYSYIEDKPADLSQCKKGKYDGSVVFKDIEGDIKLAMDFNITPECNRIEYQIEGKKYKHPISQLGLNFFGQVLGQRPSTPEPATTP